MRQLIPVKIKRMIKEGCSDLTSFGMKMMLAKQYWILTDESVKSIKRKNQVILEYLEKHYGYLLEKYQAYGQSVVEMLEADKAPVWVLWWTGEEEMPEIIKLCHQSKLKNAGEHPVILLSKDNIRQYIEFPEDVWEQFEQGKLRIQHLADMIRVQLIARYGGLWLDASIFCKDIIPEMCFRYPLYSIKGEVDNRFVSNNQWTTFAIGGQKSNRLCEFLNEFFIDYCKNGKPFIDYFMFDCAIALAYEHINEVRIMIDNLPTVEDYCYWLNENLNCAMTEELMDTFQKQKTVFYKIAWKREILLDAKDNTLASYLKEVMNE